MIAINAWKAALTADYAEAIVANKIIVELKTVKELGDIHTAVLLSYLTATNLAVGLLLNFAKSSLEFKRVARTKRSS